MRTKIFILPLIIIFAAACDLKEDRIYDESPDDRLNKVMNEYQQILVSSPNGWLMPVNTGVNGGYMHWIAFEDNNRLAMLSDLDATWALDPKWGEAVTSKTPKESSYRFRATQLPSLLFDTYNYLHILADPQGNDNNYMPGNGGRESEGLKSDYDFYITGIDGGRINLLGRHYNTKAVLIPATAQEARVVNSGGLKQVHYDFNKYRIDSFDFIMTTVDGKEVNINLTSRHIVAQWLVNKSIQMVSAGIYIDQLSSISDAPTSNIYFFEPLKINQRDMTNIMWENNGYVMYDTDGNAYPLYSSANSNIPILIGPGTPYGRITIDEGRLGANMSEAFFSDVFNVTKSSLAGGGRVLNYLDMTFGINSGNEDIIILKLSYTSAAGTYIGTWHYKYVFSPDRTQITLTDRDQSGHSNERQREPDVKDLINYFCDVQYSSSSGDYTNWVKSSVTPRTFSLKWEKNSVYGSMEVIASMTPVDDPSYVCNVIITN